MHINEQSPRVLQRQLGAYFPQVLLWFVAHDLAAPFENLERRFLKNEMRAAADLFAIASHIPIGPCTLHKRIMMQPITPPIELYLELLETPFVVRKESKFPMRVRLPNNSRVDLKSWLSNPVHLSYHCYSEAQQVGAFDGLRTTIPTLKAGSTEEIEMQLAAPSAEGRFLFRLILVQERLMWFDEFPQSLFVEAWLEVV
jgi:hypothetical protein